MAQQELHGTSRTGGDRRDLARQEGAAVADDAKQQARETAGTAKQEAAHVADEARHQARDLAHDARRQLHDQARHQTDNVGGALDRFGDQLHALAEGRRDEAGAIGDYADRMAGQVDDLADRIQQLGFDGVVDEVQRFARRRPGAFLAGALVAGFVTSRLARGIKDAGGDESSAGSTGRSTAAPAETTGTEQAYGETVEPTPTVPPPTPMPEAGDQSVDLTDRPDPLSSGRSL